MSAVPSRIVVVGAPTALGGHFGGMERTPRALRAAGLLEAVAARPGLAGRALHDAGDPAIEPGWRPDPDPRTKNRELIATMLPRLAAHVAAAVERGDRVLALGGDCTTHAGVAAGLRRALGGAAARVGIAWFDAHGDFNSPDSTPSGNVWGMPFAMLCGRGDPDLVAACDGPVVREEDAALLGGQVLDEDESRRLASSAVAHFGAGMLATAAGRAALEGWASIVGARVDALYIAFDLDAIDASEGIAVAMPEPQGIAVATAIEAVRALAARTPVAGIGATAAMFGEGEDPDRIDRTVEVIAALAEAALAGAAAET